SMYFAVAAGSPNAEAAAAFVDWMVNSPEGGTTLLAERGVPANLDVREAVLPELADSDRTAVDFIEASADEPGDPPPIPPPGGAAVAAAPAGDTGGGRFGRADAAAGSAAMVEEAAGLLGCPRRDAVAPSRSRCSAPCACRQREGSGQWPGCAWWA